MWKYKQQSDGEVYFGNLWHTRKRIIFLNNWITHPLGQFILVWSRASFSLTSTYLEMSLGVSYTSASKKPWWYYVPIFFFGGGGRSFKYPKLTANFIHPNKRPPLSVNIVEVRLWRSKCGDLNVGNLCFNTVSFMSHLSKDEWCYCCPFFLGGGWEEL